jgi:hypothetical protein
MPSGEPSLTFKALTCGLLIIISTLSLTISGGLIPTVIEVGTLGLGRPNKSFNGSLAFLAFRSHNAISIPA